MNWKILGKFITVWKAHKKSKQLEKDEKLMERNRRIAELEEFARPGDDFYYLGLRYVCVYVGYLCKEPDFCGSAIYAEAWNPVKAKVQTLWLWHGQLEAVKKENARYVEKGAEDETETPD